MWTLTRTTLSGDVMLSLHVLQRNDVTLMSSSGSTSNVTSLRGETEDMTVRLSNPENDADTYAFVATSTGTFRGNVSWSTPTPTKNVAQGGSSFPTMSVVVDGDVLALETFGLRLTATSLQNGALDSVLVPVAAAPDRSWSLNTTQLLETVLPEAHWHSTSLTNLGNAPDQFLRVRPVVQWINGDTSTWKVDVMQSNVVQVGSSTTMETVYEVPIDAWNGTMPALHIEALWNDQTLGEPDRQLAVARASGWAVNLTGVDLVVRPGWKHHRPHTTPRQQPPRPVVKVAGVPVSPPTARTWSPSVHRRSSSTSHHQTEQRRETWGPQPPHLKRYWLRFELCIRFRFVSADTAISHGVEGAWPQRQRRHANRFRRNDGNDSQHHRAHAQRSARRMNQRDAHGAGTGEVQGHRVHPAFQRLDGTGRLITVTIDHPRPT